MKFNVWTVISAIFTIYMANSLYHLYLLYFPTLCTPGLTATNQKHSSKSGGSASSNSIGCLEPAVDPTLKNVQLRLYYTLNGRNVDFQNGKIFRKESMNLSVEFTEIVQLRLPAATRKNGTLWIHAFLTPPPPPTNENRASTDDDPTKAEWYLERKSLVTSYTYPLPDTINLLGKNDGQQQQSAVSKGHNNEGAEGRKAVDRSTSDIKHNNLTTSDKPVTHLRSILPLIGIGDPLLFDWNKIPGEIAGFLQLNDRRRYLPIFSVDELSFRVRDLVRVKDDDSSDRVNLTVRYQPISVGKLRLLVTAKQSTETLKFLGFTEKDIDEVKGIFTDTNFYFLALTFAVAAVHLMLDFLAFKNDINFWRGRKTMVGLSTKTLLWRCFSQVVVFFYLMDESTSLLVLVPTAVGALIEIWKLTKAFKMRLTLTNGFPRITFGERTTREQETDSFDSQGMTYLAYLLTPLCLCGAVYSLLYIPHKSWYSWFIQSLANAVYAFGFLFMLPQLFINYKLKSVAHLPWRAFMYKAFNTFIDDLFAFIITMPAAHRVACFRDDVVFVVYLYQRYLYPVDKRRVNEFGESFVDEDTVVAKTKKTD